MNRFFPLLFSSVLSAFVLMAFPVATIAQTTATGAAAQASLTTLPTADQIRMLLQSTDRRDQTWGAWWVTQTRARNMDALLQSNLRARLTNGDILDSTLIDVTLDAFIQLDGNAPPLELLQSIYAVRPAQGLILLSRVFPRPPADAFLLTLLDQESGKGRGLEWFAAANLLIRDRAPGLVASLLKGLRIEAVVVVCDRGQPCIRQNLGHGSVGDGFGRPLTGLPPWPLYYLTVQNPVINGPGSVILAAGPTSIGYQRNVLPAGVAPDPANYPRDSQTRTPPSPTTSERLKYVAAAAPGIVIPIQDNETRTLVWQDSQTLASEVEKFREDIVGRYSTLVQRLRGTGFLSAEEAEKLAKPNLEVIIDDRHSPSPQQ